MEGVAKRLRAGVEGVGSGAQVMRLFSEWCQRSHHPVSPPRITNVPPRALYTLVHEHALTLFLLCSPWFTLRCVSARRRKTRKLRVGMRKARCDEPGPPTPGVHLRCHAARPRVCPEIM